MNIVGFKMDNSKCNGSIDPFGMIERPLRIAMLGHKRIPSREGGVEVVVEELSKRMVGLGHDVVCYNRRGHHVIDVRFDKRNLSEYQGIRLKRVMTFDLKGLAAMTASFFASLSIAFGEYDVAHYHAEGSCIMMWIPKLLGKRCVVTIHGLDHKRAKWGRFARACIMWGEKCAAKYADEIIVLSKGVQQYFKDVYGRETKYIPNGVIRPDIAEADLINTEFALEKDSYILFLGRIVPEKGLKYLIEAYKQVKTDKKLVIAGGSSDTDRFITVLKALSRGDARIVFTGFVQGQLLHELYSNAYIYTLPSDLEGMPLSLLEAMSYGRCCLVSDIAECADVVEEMALAFSKGNVSDLRDKLQLLCDSPEIVDKYKESAADFILRRHSWDDAVWKTLELYHNTSQIQKTEMRSTI